MSSPALRSFGSATFRSRKQRLSLQSSRSHVPPSLQASSEWYEAFFPSATHTVAGVTACSFRPPER